jgi:uncharacterized protein
LIHAFSCCGKYLVLDVESGALHEPDKSAFEILSAQPERWEGVPDAFVRTYGSTVASETGREIEELIVQGLLYSTPLQADVSTGNTVFKALCLHASHACNLRCAYCFAGQGNYGGNETLLSRRTGEKALDWLAAHSGSRKHLEVDFFGGEPLMNVQAIREIVAYGRELEKQTGKVISFTLTTNGVDMDEPTMDFINREMDNVVISIDGRPSVHDRYRKMQSGKGSFDNVIKGAKALIQKRKGKSYYIRGTFTRQNLDFINDVLFLVDEGFDAVSLEPVVADENAPYSIRVEDLPRVKKEYETLAKAYVERRRQGKGFTYFHFMLSDENSPCLAKRTKGCGAGFEYAAVSPEGDLYPCHQFTGQKQWRLGNVFKDELNTEIVQRFQSSSILSKSECMACWAKYYCGGGCPANAYAFNKDINKPYAFGCEMQKKRLECALFALASQEGTNL